VQVQVQNLQKGDDQAYCADYPLIGTWVLLILQPEKEAAKFPASASASDYRQYNNFVEP